MKAKMVKGRVSSVRVNRAFAGNFSKRKENPGILFIYIISGKVKLQNPFLTFSFFFF